jgi:Zn-dependent protease with chaperone function
MDLLNIFKDYNAGENIRSLNVAEEPAKYIKKLYIIFGNELVDNFSPRELTSILLHELGHSFTYTSNLPRILLTLCQKGIGVIGITLRLPILWLFNLISLPAYIISSLIIMTIVRSLTFIEHKSEYKADQFPIKYGYGDEIVKVLYKLHNKQVEKESRQSWWEKIWNFIESLFSPSTHPASSSRIEEVNDQMVNEYKKLYPKLSTELSIILKDIKK